MLSLSTYLLMTMAWSDAQGKCGANAGRMYVIDGEPFFSCQAEAPVGIKYAPETEEPAYSRPRRTATATAWARVSTTNLLKIAVRW